MIIAFAAFQSGQNLMDLVALFAIGLLGILMRRFDWSRPAFLIGFVLANPVENYANNANQIAGIRFRESMEAGAGLYLQPDCINAGLDHGCICGHWLEAIEKHHGRRGGIFGQETRAYDLLDGGDGLYHLCFDQFSVYS